MLTTQVRAKQEKMKIFLSFVIAVAASLSGVRAADPLEFTVGGVTFQRPDGWGWVVPNSPMRKAQLTPPPVGESAAGEVTFFHFGPDQGGTVQQNIQRWVAQFQGGADALQKVEEYASAQVTYVTAAGTFSSGMPGGPTVPLEGYGLLGAILEGPEGNVFVKMTGPESVVRAATTAFEAMMAAAAGGPKP